VREIELALRPAELPAGVAGPRAGMFGPGSPAWEVHAPSVIFLGAGRAALLQLAHPWVAAAIRTHSAVAGDALGRFRRTFEAVLDMLFGDWEAAEAAALRVHAVHRTIHGAMPEAAGAFAAGSPYRALDVPALRWVHATLCDTSLQMYETLVRTLDAAEREAYYADSRRFAGLFGLRAVDLPESAVAFDRYFRAMCDGPLLGASEETAAFARALMRPRHRALRPVFAVYARLTAQWLPEGVRAAMGLPAPRPLDRALLRASVGALRTWPLWPRSLRYLPAYLRAVERCGGPPTPRLARLVERQLFVDPRGTPRALGTRGAAAKSAGDGAGARRPARGAP
jgi:uncharacterized protein (DUF2236 family)